MLDRWKRRWASLRAHHRWLDVALDVQGRFNELHGGHLAGAVTLSAFLSLFPLMLVAVAVLGTVAHGRPDVTRHVLDALAIPNGGAAAQLVRDTVATAEESRQAASIVGVLGLLWTGLGLVSTLQYVHDSVWQVTGRGLRDRGIGLLWLVGSVLLFALSFALTSAVQLLPPLLAPLEIVLALALGVGMFLWADKLLANTDVGWRAVVPGAVAASIGFEVLKVVGGIYVPRAVASSSALYGSLGVVFAILAWLFFFGRLIVYSTALNVVLWERSRRRRRLPPDDANEEAP